MNKKIIENKQGTLNWRDLVKGLVIAVITPVFTIIVESLQNDDLTINLKSIGTVALVALLSYLSKNLGDPTQTVEIIKPLKKK